MIISFGTKERRKFDLVNELKGLQIKFRRQDDYDLEEEANETGINKFDKILPWKRGVTLIIERNTT